MMRPTNLVNSQLSPSFGLNQRTGSPSLSPEINMMLMSNRNDDKTTDMVKIDEIHRAVTLGNLRNVQQLIDRKRLAYCRDQMGATPLHKAVIYGQKEIIEYFLDRFPSTIHTRDNRGRTPLHYAAVLPESADLYRMLAEAGADEKALDMFGKKPEDYLNHQDGVSVVVLRESAIVTRPLGQRRSRKSASRMIDPQSWSKIHSSRSLMHRSNIRELIKQGNITTLEEIVIQGYGDRLIGETSSAPLVQEFLKNVPQLIEQINELHKAAQRGNLNDLRSLLDRKGIVFARDQIGCTPLHKAVLYGQLEVTSFLSSEYPATLDARDHDGRTALHYAAGLDDERAIYNILVKHGASPNLPDYKGRSAEYYVRFPDQINIQQLMKRSQRLNANYAINTANRIKSKSPCRRRGLSPEARKPDIHTREEVTSANLKRWIQELDLNSLEGAILEGHGDRVRSKVEMYDGAKELPDIQNYIHETLPKVMTKIRKIHAAVSCGDLTGLQDHLDKNDYALAKDHLGMAPLHKAVILGHIDVVQFILDRFPETVNARDREGRTPLHYAAATTHKNGHKIYKMLLRSGADSRARDAVGKTAEYYRVHFMPLPSELSRLAAHYKRKSGDGHQASSPLHKRRGILLPSTREKISNALHEGDASTLLELVLDGYGDALLGRASWGEEARKFLKGLPHLLDSIRTLHASIVNGELANVQRILDTDPNLIKAKDENGLMAIHLAVSRDQQEIVDYLLEKFPSCLQLKDQFGRTGLHIAAQNKQQDIYKKLIDAGGDPMIIDQRGRTADHYLKLQATGEAYLNKLFASTPVKEDPSKRANDKSVNGGDKNGVVNEHQENDKQGQQSEINMEEKAEEDKPQNEENETNNIEEDESKSNTNITEEAPDDGISENNQVNDENEASNSNNEVKTELEEDKSGEAEIPAQNDETVNESLQQSASGDDNNADLEETKSEVSKVDQAVDAKTLSGSEDSFDNDNNPEESDDHFNDQSTTENQQTLQKETESTEEGNTEAEPDKPDGGNNVEPSEETDIDEEKLQNNRQDAIVNENTSPDKKETNQSSVTSKSSKIALKKKQTSLPQVEKKVKGNRKASLPSVVNNINSSKDRLDKKKAVNNRNTSNFGTKGTTERDKEDGVKPNSETSIKDNKVTEEVDANESAKKLSDSNEEEEQSKVTIQNASKIAEAFIGDLPEAVNVSEDTNDPPNEASKLPSSMEEVQGDSQSINTNDSAPPPTENNQNTEIDNSGKLEKDNLSEAQSNSETDVEKQAKEIVQELVETSIQEAESKLALDEDTKITQEINSSNSENISEGNGETEEEKIEPENKDDKIDSNQSLEKQVSEENPSSEMDIQKTNENNDNKVLPTNETNSLNNIDMEPAGNNSELKSDQPTDLTAETVPADKNAEMSESESKAEPGVDKTTLQVSDEKVVGDETTGTNEETTTEQSNAVAEESNQEKDETENVMETEQKVDLVSENSNEDQKESISVVNDIVDANGNKPEQATDDDVEENDKKESGHDHDQPNGEIDSNESKPETEINGSGEQKGPDVLDESKSSDNNTLTNGNGDDLNESIIDNTEAKDFLKTGSETSKPKSSESTSSRFLNETSPVTNSDSNSDMLNDLIETWLKEGDLLRLEHVVIAGQGERLIDKKSPKETVQEFLDLVPAYMAKIKNVHDTVVRGNFNEVRSILTRKRFALSRDHVGASPLHLAVLHGHMDVLVYIITQFPETLDGPDNEGRTPLHYAAVMASKDRQYYDILKKAGANASLIDKLGNTADYYLDHPDELTIGDLLSNYKHKTESATKRKEPESVDVWQRPPTADIESRLTPSPSDSQLEEDKGPIHHEIAADVHVDAKIKERPTTGSTVNPEEDEVKKEVETISVQFKETLKEEKNKLQESIRRIMGAVPSQPPESLSSGEESDEKKSEDTVSEYELCQVKDEHGRTVLHLVSSKPQKKAILYQMLASAEYLIPERDEKYRTIRDVAVDAGLKDNVQVIDNYILDAFVRRNVGFVQRLSHEGYDLTNVVDEEGHDVTSVLRKRKITSMINLLQDITYFQKSREELHTFIKNDYIQGVLGLIDTDSTLVTAKNRRGRTALHIAILFGNLDIISNLIDANPGAASVQDNLGRTPLHYAMATSKVEHIGKMLIKAGANRQIRDVKMRTPSYYFVYNDDIRAIRSEEKATI
ncbi:uncharacterized protein LOC107363890 isoform X2 [Tetranychus urticae]|uniref:uncharacterized protein LOC107363890 isoform X2 n=1 Tax=Tetranychus urticae TaxID=32264 RepID=UPI00077BDDCD|nr:uncharacterized protein LOC107363890 isoform X2 [Tetranychus urticae]